MKILFYQLNSKKPNLQSWKEGKYFGHPIFGATHFPQYGIDVEMSYDKNPDFYKKVKKNFKIELRRYLHSFKIAFSSKKYDLIYAPYPQGLEILILLRRLGLFRTPIAIFAHQTLRNPPNAIKRAFFRNFYKGVDILLFFSKTHYQESVDTGISDPAKMHTVSWGPDLDFYDKAIAEINEDGQDYFVSTGKSKRDYKTVVDAFAQTESVFKLFVDDKVLEQQLAVDKENVQIIYQPVTTTSPYFLAAQLAKSIAVTICTQKVKGLNGITNLYEAMAMSKPVIITRNKYIDLDVEKEKIGLVVEVGDVEGWKKAINFFEQNPEIAAEYGKRGRELSEKEYNLALFSQQVATVFKNSLGK